MVYPTPGHGKYVRKILLLDDLRGIAQIYMTSKVKRILEEIPRFIIAGIVVINSYNPT
jgi:hypothetical protein